MIGRIPTGGARLVAAVLLALAAMAATAATAGAEVIYDNIPSPLPGNFASYGNEAYSVAEFGGEVGLAGSARKNPTVTVVMSSWACQRGSWVAENCESGLPKMKRFFKVPVTIKAYAVGPGNTVGALLAQRTKTFKMQYRPSGDPVHCTGGTWYDAADSTCYHGFAFPISLKLKMSTLPSNAIISVSYNTSHHGPAPIGTSACNATSAGCPYDSLNIAFSEAPEGTLSLGSNPTEELFVNSTYNAMYCGSEATLGTFAPTGSCYEGQQPVIEVSAG